MLKLQKLVLTAVIISMFFGPFKGSTSEVGEEAQSQIQVAVPREPDFDNLYLRPSSSSQANEARFKEKKRILHDALVNGSRLEMLFVAAQLACFSFENLYELLESKDGHVLANVCQAFLALPHISEEEEAELHELFQYQSFKNFRKNVTKKISGLAYAWCINVSNTESPEKHPLYKILEHHINVDKHCDLSIEIAFNLYCTSLIDYLNTFIICQHIENNYLYSLHYIHPFLNKVAQYLIADPKSDEFISSMPEFTKYKDDEKQYRLGAAAYAYVVLHEEGNVNYDIVCNRLTPLFGSKKFSCQAKEAIKGMKKVRKAHLLFDKSRKE